MKRYKITAEYNVAGYGTAEQEDPEGEWVKWEDVKPLWLTWAAILNMNPSQIAAFIQGLPKREMRKTIDFIYIDLKDGTGGFMLPNTKESKELADELLKGPKYCLRKSK